MLAHKTVNAIRPGHTVGIRKLVTNGEQIILTVLKDIMRTFGLIIDTHRSHQWR